MSTNQENRHFTFKELHNPGGSAVKLEEDHLLGYRSAGAQATGTFNETRLDYIDKTLPGSQTDLPGAMQAFAENNSFTNWVSIGGKNADEGPDVVEGNCGVGESGLIVSVGFDVSIAGDASAGFTVYYEDLAGSPIKLASINSLLSSIAGDTTILAIEGNRIKRGARVWVDYNSVTGSIKRLDSPPAASTFWGQWIPNGSQQ